MNSSTSSTTRSSPSSTRAATSTLSWPSSSCDYFAACLLMPSRWLRLAWADGQRDVPCARPPLRRDTPSRRCPTPASRPDRTHIPLPRKGGLT